MNIEFAIKVLLRIGRPDPPGGCGTFLEHPNLAYRKERAVEIGFVIEHRFAFHYWLKSKQEAMTHRRLQPNVSDEEFVPPDLITWDWHDDVGVESDFIEDELRTLNQADEQEVALFCWAGLTQINDGHIAPALWLNALGNVYVLQKQLDEDECSHRSKPFVDRYGKEHQVHYFRDNAVLAECFAKTNSQAGVIWDLDMDFFTEEDGDGDLRYNPPIADAEIEELLVPSQPWMQQILRDLRAITIALEPEYTGGLAQSLSLYQAWESALFAGAVFARECRWKEGVAEAL